MTTDIVLQAGLDERWRGIVQRQLDLKLASVAWLVRTIRVELAHFLAHPLTHSKEAGASGMYRCRIDATLRNATTISIAIDSVLGESCLADAAARLRRELGRELQFGSARRASSAAPTRSGEQNLPS